MRLRGHHWLLAMTFSVAAHAALLTQFGAVDEGVMVEAGEGADSPVWGLPIAAFAEEVSAGQVATPAVDLPPGPSVAATVLETAQGEKLTETATRNAFGSLAQGQVAAETPTVPEIAAEAAAVPTGTVDPLAAAEAVPPAEPILADREAAVAQTDSAEADVPEPVEVAPIDKATDVAMAPPVETVSAEEVPAAPVPVSRPDPPVAAAAPARQTAPPPRPQTAANAPAGRAVGGRGAAADALGRDIRSNYSGRVLVHLERAKRYPRAAQSRRIAGAVTVRFTLGGNGGVRGSSIVRSSGHDILDGEVRAMLVRANPFPAIPAETGRQSMTFTVTIRFVPR